MGSRRSRALHLGIRALPIISSSSSAPFSHSPVLCRHALYCKMPSPSHALFFAFARFVEAPTAFFSHPHLTFSRTCSTLDTVSESEWPETDEEYHRGMTKRSSDSSSDWSETEEEAPRRKPMRVVRKALAGFQTEDDSAEEATTDGQSPIENESEEEVVDDSDVHVCKGGLRAKCRSATTGYSRGSSRRDENGDGSSTRECGRYSSRPRCHWYGSSNGRSLTTSESECSETDDELAREIELSTDSESEWSESEDASSQKFSRKASEAFETEDDNEEEGNRCMSSDEEIETGIESVAGSSSKFYRDYERSRDVREASHSLACDSHGVSIRKYIRDSDSDDVEVESGSEDELQAEVERQMAAEPKVVRPSITWGILLTKEHRQTAKETVLSFLKSEGIQTAELRPIELPTTVDVMKTRLGFLRKLGLSNDDINNYPLVLGCSVRKNMVPVLRYLKKLGIKEHCVTGLLRKYPMILHSSVVIDILPVIYFLRGLDIDPLDLPPVLTRYPDVLGFKTEGTMSTSVAYLVSMGVKMRHVGQMLTDFPDVLGMRVASVIKPKFEYLMGLGVPQTIVARILERRPQILGYDLESRMKYNVSQLVGIGVQEEALPGMIAQFPELLGRVFSPSLVMQIDWLKKVLELDLDGVSRMIEKMPQVIFLKEEVAMGRIRFLKSQRFFAREIGLMASQCPQILIANIDDALKPNLTFIVRDMKRTRQEVIEYPACLTYGLETRLRPRFNSLAEKQKCCSLEWLLNCSDGKFQRRVAADYEDVKDTRHYFRMGGQLPGRIENGGQSNSFTSVLTGVKPSSSMNAGSVPSLKRDLQLVSI